MDELEHTFDLTQQLRRQWLRILVGVIVGGLGAVGYMLFAPRWYKAESIVAPMSPKAGAGLAALASGGGALGGVAGALELMEGGIGGQETERIAAVFKSNYVTDGLIKKFDLMSKYHDSYVEEAREDVWKHCNAKVDKKPGLINVTCEDKSAETAQAMVEFLGTSGSEALRRMSSSTATAERTFLEQRVARARIDLDESSEKLRQFSEKNKLVELNTQARVLVGTMAELNGQLIARKMELSYLSAYSAAEEPTVKQLQMRIGIIEGQLRALENSGDSEGTIVALPGKAPRPGASDDKTTIFPPAGEVPRLQVELAQIYRDVRIQETVFLLLMQMYETARVNEARRTPTFQILDPPVLPTKYVWPKKVIVIPAAMILGIALGACWALGPAWLAMRRHRRRPLPARGGATPPPENHDS